MTVGNIRTLATVGIDLAKNVFSLHGVDAEGRVVLRKQVTRTRLLSLMARLPPCRVGMEACSGAHYWGREFRRMGHDVGIMPARFVTPYRKGGKNDGNDAEAICEAVGRPSMRFVNIKTEEQQAALMLHRTRQMLVRDRTAQVNQLRGLMMEFGLVLPVGRYVLQSHLPAVVRAAGAGVPELAKRLFLEMHERILHLSEQILAYEKELADMQKHHAVVRRLMTIPGVGSITASAIYASVERSEDFSSGRQFSAWLGLVPRQYSTGGKPRLGRITGRGDAYLRSLLVQGARVVLTMARRRSDAVSVWLTQVYARRGYMKACVAMAAKMARIIWAVMVGGTDYQERMVAYAG